MDASMTGVGRTDENELLTGIATRFAMACSPHVHGESEFI